MSPSMNGQPQQPPLELANKLISFLDDANQQATTNPEGMLSVTLFASGGPIGDDIYLLCKHVIEAESNNRNPPQHQLGS